MDAAQQIQNVVSNSMGATEQTPMTVDTGDVQEDAADAVTDAVERLLKLEQELSKDPAAAARAGHLQIVARRGAPGVS